MRAGDGCAGCRPADSLQMGLLEAYSEIHPTIRDLAYEAMEL